MASQNIVWAEGDVPEAVESWVAGFFAAADTKGDAAAKRFSEFFHDDGVMVGMGPALHGKQGSTPKLIHCHIKSRYSPC